MEKIIIGFMLILFSFIIYANGQQVTADMLVGKWKCSLVDFGEKFYKESEFDSAKNYENEQEPMRTRPLTHTFKKENKSLIEYYYRPDIKRIYRENLSDCVVLSHCETIGDFDGIGPVTKITDRIYISDDEFKIKFIELSNYSTTQKSMMKHRTESSCTRIK